MTKAERRQQALINKLKAEQSKKVPPPPSIQLPSKLIAKLLWVIPCVVLGLVNLLLAFKTDYLGLENSLYRIAAILCAVIMLIITVLVITKTSRARGPFNLPHYTLRWFYPCTVAELLLLVGEFIVSTHTLKRVVLLMLFVVMLIQIIMTFIGIKLDKYRMLQLLKIKRRC